MKQCFKQVGFYKISTEYHLQNLLRHNLRHLRLLIEDCCSLHGDDFIFQHDAAPAHSAKLTQAWLSANCRDFINKDSWPPNSPDMNPLDFHVWGAMLL